MKYATKTLIRTIEKNRARHLRAYERELAKKKRDWTRRFQKSMRRVAKAGGAPMYVNVSWYPPKHNLASYDTTLAMLRMTTQKEIELTRTDFHAYVLDDWARVNQENPFRTVNMDGGDLGRGTGAA